jgi:CDP-diacylglycerol--glycerol-3-phosphate 3-phosphatidyltransferase
MRFSLANTITILRLPLLGIVVYLLYQETANARITAAALLTLLILMDTFDGVVARRRHEETLLGSTLDIAVDRAVELVLWVTFAHLGLIPVFIPLVIIVRGVLTDSIRGVAGQHGLSAHNMMGSPWGKWLVASPPMRTGYAITKLVAFVTLTLTLAVQASGQPAGILYQFGVAAAWLATAICILRGLPVLMEAPGLMRTLAGES